MEVVDLIGRRAALTPDRIAVVELETGQRYTYAELNARANQSANFFQQICGVEAGDRVSILAKNSIVYLDLLNGLSKIGAIFAPFNWRLTATEIAYMVEDLEPKVVVCDPEFIPIMEAIGEKLPLPTIVHLGQANSKDVLLYHEEIEKASAELPPDPGMDIDSPYAILYTSGTTGHPKGAIIPYRQVLFNCINTVVSWGLTSEDVSPIYTPLFHAGGLFAFLMPLLYLGGRIVLARDFDPEASLKWILEEGCTVILGVPTLYQMWLESEYFDQADVSHVRFFISGGAACPVQLMASWRQTKGVVFRQGYGLTEVGVNCFTMTDEESVQKTGSVGKPVFHSQARIVDPETREIVSPGVSGELQLRGPHVSLGYWRNPEATQASIQDGWFHTGDMAHVDEDGFFFIDGRYKDMIKSGGENIYAAEVENVFRSHPAVKDAALIGKPDKKWGEVGVLILALEAGAQVDVEALKTYCSDQLARFKIPKEFHFVDELPYSAYGKVEKVKLKTLFLGPES
jgi:fatty-acyl-CoA synthase